MSFQFEILLFNSSSARFLPIKKVVSAIKRVFDGEGVVGNVKVNVIYLDDEEIHKMNNEYLNHDYPTDVITFTIEEKPLEGEIYIGVNVAKEQAKEYGASLGNECIRLAVHGALHLCRYDDDTEEKRQTMHLLENKYINEE